MRRIYSLPLMTALALAGLSSCSSSDDPTTDPSVSPSETVKTSFTLSVGLPKGGSSAAAKPSTRVSDAVAQAQGTPVFRGIDNIKLIPFNIDNNGTITSTSIRNGNNVNLPNSVANSLESTQLGTLNSKLYNDVNIPLGTTNFLFYGKAIDANAGEALTTPEQQFQYGTITADGFTGNTPNGISFTPKSIYTGETENEVAAAITAYLNKIVGTTYTPNDATESSSWATYAGASPTSGLGQLYNDFTKLQAGSSTSVQYAISELYKSLNGLQPTTGSNEEKLVTAIKANIVDGTDATENASAEGNSTLTFTNVVSGYPGNINLPDGAASLSFSEGTFKENTTAATLTDGTQISALSDYAFPVNLWYFANTPVRTSNNDLSNQYTGDTWAEVLAKFGADNGFVGTTTRSIALVNQIQYAVGRLQTLVKAGDATLLDRTGKPITVEAQTFPVTAIFVGGQRPVDWEFKPVVGQNVTQYNLYDKVPENTIYATTDNTKSNQTLVLESLGDDNASSEDLKEVKIVVEFQNNSGVEFTGRDGVIPIGSKFYLVATLDPRNTNHENNPENIDQVFKQDYVTTANLTISKNDGTDHTSGLGAAYSFIPDLRTPVLSIGMSVDLSWQNGLTFDVNL